MFWGAGAEAAILRPDHGERFMFAVLGATGKTGRYLVEKLCANGHDVLAVGRSQERLAALGGGCRHALADFDHPLSVAKALIGASHILSLAPASHTRVLLECLPSRCERLVLTGSTRRFTALPDAAADTVRAAEALFLTSGVSGVMLHPSMIYGAPDDRNINRLLKVVRGARVLPLPNGGRNLVQPVFVDDMVAACAAAATEPSAPGPSIVVAGPEPITDAHMLRAGAAAPNRSNTVVPLPGSLMHAGVAAAQALGIETPFNAAEIRRAMEDKAFPIAALTSRLGITPRSFEEGLRLKLERGWVS